jgi:hypothetical protein
MFDDLLMQKRNHSSGKKMRFINQTGNVRVVDGVARFDRERKLNKLLTHDPILALNAV